jgi:hypothetical protein
MVQNGKVKIYLADIRPLFDETMQKKALAQLDEVRRQKALSCRQTKQRAASLTAGQKRRNAETDLTAARCVIPKTGSRIFLYRMGDGHF